VKKCDKLNTFHPCSQSAEYHPHKNCIEISSVIYFIEMQTETQKI